MSGADILLDRPPGGWSDLVTNQSLDLRFAAFEERVDRKLDALEHVSTQSSSPSMRVSLSSNTNSICALRRSSCASPRSITASTGSSTSCSLQVDRRLRSQAWMTISTIVAVGGVLVAAIRL